MAEEQHTDDHGRGKTVTIVVNGREKVVQKERLSFQEVLDLVDNLPTGPNYEYTVTYHRGPHGHQEGSLTPGQSVEIKDGMVFNVTATDKS